ncbi:LacI family DNA-binding transcriptional regulator [Paracoccus sp. Z330]|uniref:LacI family DNA-binding transcriptional regulator n=1 Tax=Paracoccus onchidii TaxID=3017813 RepID=A0ABT4ZH43_9RHOB|nr:LacI family DNA-binding transcriptional regulator [Paracoccus onchidii]MDB6178674.1 LacI family DNA-binding transcriptional regulator [Paracoccus onchidii]
MKNASKAPQPGRRASIKDVAARAGVSTATVSHVFSGKKHVNEALEKRVRAAARELDYSVDRVASRLRSGKAKVIAVMVPDLEDLFLSRFVSRIEAQAEDSGFEVILSCSRNDPELERTRLRAMLAWRPTGLVFVPCHEELPMEVFRDHPDLPIIGADRVNPSLTPFDTVTVDNYGSGWTAADNLILKGAKKILMLSSITEIATIRERIRGARERIERERDVELQVLAVGSEPTRGAEKLTEWFGEHGLPDAVISLTNVMTLAALATFAQIGIEAPDDLLLIGYHDSLWMTARKVPITTVSLPIDDVARAVWQRLESRVAGDSSPNRNTVLSTTLIERDTTLGRRPSR